MRVIQLIYHPICADYDKEAVFVNTQHVAAIEEGSSRDFPVFRIVSHSGYILAQGRGDHRRVAQLLFGDSVLFSPKEV
jgi:hypothetical protein